MMRVPLKLHPDSSSTVKSVEVEIVATDVEDVLLRFIVDGIAQLALPEWRPAKRTDDLWQTTCFELFLKPEGADAYYEFNFSPSTRWAAYAFDSYREGMRALTRPVAPHIERVEADAAYGATRYILDADVDLAGLANRTTRIAVCAVIEATDGTKSYWAIAHPPGKPDFHHPDSFALELPAETFS